VRSVTGLTGFRTKRDYRPSQTGGLSACGWALILSLPFVLFAPTAVSHATEPVRSLWEMRHERVVAQKWDLSCGAAALATLLSYDLSNPISERTVAEGVLRHADATQVHDQGGFSLLNLQEFVEKLGYHADGYGQMSMQDLAAMLPAIVPIRVHGYDHFVLVRSIRDDAVYFADPAFGNRHLAVDRFDAAWPLKVAFIVSRDER
jgi:uncharacterized protein